jgi:hypothetical protein
MHETCSHGLSIAQDVVQWQAGVLLVLTPQALLPHFDISRQSII